MARKRASERQQEQQTIAWIRAGDNLTAVLKTAIKWGFLALIAYFGLQAVKALAGQTTAANIGIKVLGDIRISDALAVALGLSGVGYGTRERSLRRKTVQKMQSRIEKLEKKLDPRRSSSELTPEGDTNPGDE